MARARQSNWLHLSSSLRRARHRRRPIVALESAVLTHGLPASERLSAVHQLEESVRRAGAAPAFIALLGGKARVGLTRRELETLAATPRVAKCARADLGWLLAQKASAGTTVSATIFIAAQAGIEVVATGGIGGVHRDAAASFDVSADLVELARTPVTLVASGAKTIVDLRKTLEFLESASVPVIGYQTQEFPGFLVRDTGLPLRAMARDLGELAAAVRAYRATRHRGAVLVANPIPAEAALPPTSVEPLIAEALTRAAAHGVTGTALTPFLLEAINELSGGATLRANRALLGSNAVLAGCLAVALARPRRRFPPGA